MKKAWIVSMFAGAILGTGMMLVSMLMKWQASLAGARALCLLAGIAITIACSLGLLGQRTEEK